MRGKGDYFQKVEVQYINPDKTMAPAQGAFMKIKDVRKLAEGVIHKQWQPAQFDSFVTFKKAPQSPVKPQKKQEVAPKEQINEKAPKIILDEENLSDEIDSTRFPDSTISLEETSFVDKTPHDDASTIEDEVNSYRSSSAVSDPQSGHSSPISVFSIDDHAKTSQSDEDKKQLNIKARNELSSLIGEDVTEMRYRQIVDKIVSKGIHRDHLELVNTFIETSSYNPVGALKLTEIASKPLEPRKKLTLDQANKLIQGLLKETPNTLNFAALPMETKSRIFYATLRLVEMYYDLKCTDPKSGLKEEVLDPLQAIKKRSSLGEEKALIDLIIKRLENTLSAR